MTFRKMTVAVLVATLLANLAGCGTLMYPERRGQVGGHIDAGIAVLDGIGLLFFIIPGVIAFAVDFSDGAIYLPGGPRHADGGNVRVVSAGHPVDRAYVEQAVAQETGVRVRLDDPRASARHIHSVDEVRDQIERLDAPAQAG